MRIYLDTCCYNRPFDKSQEKSVHDESNALTAIFNMAAKNYITILGSDILTKEFDALKDDSKKSKLKDLYLFAKEEIHFSEQIKNAANFFMTSANIKSMDALHIACAEAGKADYFLTTDYRLIKSCVKLAINLKVVNPIDYLARVNLTGGFH